MPNATSASWLLARHSTRAPGPVVLIRCMWGLVFACAGILKLQPFAALGTRRFDEAGIPAPGFFSTLDGIVEIGRGLRIPGWVADPGGGGPMILDMCATAIWPTANAAGSVAAMVSVVASR